MKKCKQCGTESSDVTKKCPGCGSSISKRINYEQLKFDKRSKIKFAVIIMLSLGIVSSAFSEDTLTENNTAVESVDENVVTEETVALSKDEIIAMDKNLLALLFLSQRTTSDLQNKFSEYDQGTISLVDVYQSAEKTRDIQISLHHKITELKNEDNSDYANAIDDYVFLQELFAKNVIKFLDKFEVEYQSDALENISDGEIAMSYVFEKRKEYLLGQNFEEKEIDDMLDYILSVNS